jgi:uncharacterized protein (TIGR00369 family)
MSDGRMDDERARAMKALFENAPFNRKLGVEGVLFEPGRAVLKMPFTPENTTIADVVHGGAILALADMAATAAAWTTVEEPAKHRGITADLSLSFIAAGRSQTLSADARIIKQGRSLTYLEVTVFDEAEEVVAKSLVTYKLSRIPG